MTGYILLALVVLFAAALWLGRWRADAVVGGEVARLHSRPVQHGLFLAFATAGPAFLAAVVWSVVTPGIEAWIVEKSFAPELADFTYPQVEAFIRDTRALAFGKAAFDGDETRQAAAALFRFAHLVSASAIAALSLMLAIGGFFFAYPKIRPSFRARHVVERIIRAVLIVCSAVAILTTIGIVLSLIFESLRFFGQVPFYKFLFGTHWSPQSAFSGAGAQTGEVNADIFGIIPLLAGTLLITSDRKSVV